MPSLYYEMKQKSKWQPVQINVLLRLFPVNNVNKKSKGKQKETTTKNIRKIKFVIRMSLYHTE